MTEVFAADVRSIAKAAEILRRGGLVAFPTETVYGLGANALDSVAVAHIFAAKGRPATNPIIVHIASAEQLPLVAHSPPVNDRGLNKAALLAERFWPGPLTLVLPKTAAVPDIVTAGGPTVAVRVPAHPVALALLRVVGVPLAAPSANRSTELSPTTAEHVVRSLGGAIDMILDAGPTSGGIESTVLDLTTDPPRILRPGLVTASMIEESIGLVRRFGEPGASATGGSSRIGETPVADAPGSPVRSPGMMAKHYAPRAPLELANGDGSSRVELLIISGQNVGWLTWPTAGDVDRAIRIEMPADPAAYAAKLYAALHDADAAGVDRIVVAMPPDGEDWLAIRDRLRRASSD